MTQEHFQNIAFCTDFSANADEAFQIAKDLAWRYGATLHVVHVLVSLVATPVQDAFMPVDLDAKLVERAEEVARETITTRYLSQLKQKQSFSVHILSGYGATEIVQLAEDQAIDLIVMGSHGLTGLAHVLFGSTADRVVRKSPCSVLTVRVPKK